MSNNHWESQSYLEFAKTLHFEANKLFEEANQEYASDLSWTTNFDFVSVLMSEVAGHENFSPKHAALTYLMKSIFSIARSHSTRQSMRSRYLDAINYLTIMAFMDNVGHDVHFGPMAENPIKAPTAPSADLKSNDFANHMAKVAELLDGMSSGAKLFRANARSIWNSFTQAERDMYGNYKEYEEWLAATVAGGGTTPELIACEAKVKAV